MKNKNITPINDKGERHGYWEVYYSNGQLYTKGNYVNGKPHGSWEVYYDNGLLSSKGNYVAGKLHGSWEFYYYNNGKLKSKIYYI